MYHSVSRSKDWKSKKQERRREQSVKILKIVGLGVLMLAIGAVPSPSAIGRILKELALSDTPRNRRTARLKVNYLKRRGYLRASSGIYEVSNLGQKIMDDEQLWAIGIPKQQRWNGEWHFVLFDIPQEKTSVRIPFVRHLQRLGLLFYQRSVWVYPYPMKNEILKIARHFDVATHISFITTREVSGYAQLARHFNVH